MASGRQLRLLLWKDYLIRKRKPVSTFTTYIQLFPCLDVIEVVTIEDSVTMYREDKNSAKILNCKINYQRDIYLL